MTTKVFAYNCKNLRGAAANLPLIDQQISLAHKFYNRLVELRREQFDQTESARRKLFPDLEAAEQDVEALDVVVTEIVEAIRKANAKERRKRATPAESKTLADAKAKRKEAWAKRKEIRESIAGDAKLQASLAAIYDEYQGIIPPGKTNRQGGKLKAAAATSGVYWGTKAKVFNAIDDAQKKSVGPIRFKAWTGDGQISMQIVGGCTWAEMLQGIGAASGKIRATPEPRLSAKKCPLYRFRLRAQSDGDAENCFVEIVAYVHRPLPDDAVITWVSLVRHRLAPHRMADGSWAEQYDWTVQMTATYAEIRERAPRGSCGVDVGWRVMDDDSLRIAYVIGDDGYVDDFRLPKEVRDKWIKARSLQSIRDRNFNDVMIHVAAWKKAITDVPEWLAESTVAMHAWRAKGKLIRLIRLIREHIPTDSILVTLDEWRCQDTHLWQWQIACVKQAERIRKDMYRKFAYGLSMRFASISVEDCDWHKMRQHKEANDNEDDSIMRINMNAGSVGMLREILKANGAKEVEGDGTTQTCHECGHFNDWHTADLWHTCAACGCAWDRDFNAAKNIHARGLALAKEAESLADATGLAIDGYADTEKRKGKWQRRKDDRSKKQTQSDTTS